MSNTSNSAFVIVAPNSMALRAIVNSCVLDELKARLNNQSLMVLSPENGTQNLLPEWVIWRDCFSPAKAKPLSVLRRVFRAVSVRCLKFGQLAYRFNQRHGFYAHQFKQSMDAKRRKREELAGNFVSPVYGFPFANSAFLYRLIYRLYYAKWQVADPAVEGLFDEFAVQRIVFWYAQNELYRDYSICAHKRNIPIVAVVGSWDRLTTKGPLSPNIHAYLVNSQIMREELKQYHGVEPEKVSVVGWPQMDAYCQQQRYWSKAVFIRKLNLPVNEQTKLILFAGNSARLGAHEPSIAQYINRQCAQMKYGDNVHLIIRPHPNDVDWQQRYKSLAKQSNVTLLPSQVTEVDTLLNCLLHADLVIATGGSISLDAVALDNCVINLVFEGDIECDDAELVKHWYLMEHYRPVAQSKGVRLVYDYAELDQAINDYLANPELDSNARVRLREMELQPFQGDSSKRQVEAMLL